MIKYWEGDEQVADLQKISNEVSSDQTPEWVDINHITNTTLTNKIIPTATAHPPSGQLKVEDGKTYISDGGGNWLEVMMPAENWDSSVNYVHVNNTLPTNNYVVQAHPNDGLSVLKDKLLNHGKSPAALIEKLQSKFFDALKAWHDNPEHEAKTEDVVNRACAISTWVSKRLEARHNPLKHKNLIEVTARAIWEATTYKTYTWDEVTDSHRQLYYQTAKKLLANPTLFIMEGDPIEQPK